MTNIAHSVDQAFYFITWVSVALLALVTFFMVYFAVKYRKQKNPKVEEIEGHLWVEILWTVLPTMLVMVMFYIGYTGFALMRNVPDDAMDIELIVRPGPTEPGPIMTRTARLMRKDVCRFERMTARRRGSARPAIFALLAFFATLAFTPDRAPAAPLTTGGFTFSDELGGFRLLSVSGTGSADDPIVVEEELTGAGPAILVIRRDIVRYPADPWARNGVWTAIHLTKVVRNRTGRVWIGFDLELQEKLHKPSIYGDGLSFDQGRAVPVEISSNAFARNRRLFEPYDRIRFDHGSVDPDATLRLEVHITDPTPVSKFYLVQDPQILYADIGGLLKVAGRR